ncbi:uncharacterized protein LOC125468991 [Pyrus x bretschneideri]|uniref:uncharacterized protein LOC125468991 n=1 Tax=Pyrus x bretschneideri TaxID=225117 RepID=UPI00203084B7|nr:uncharacterized protein LOC125468991 [Pyrus x bretschneideri]
MEDKVLGLQLEFPNKRLRGSSKGWLIAVNMDLLVTLINPFLRVKGRQKRADSIIDLPPLACPDNMSPRRKTIFVNKATLSADPILEADKCIVMVIHEREGNNLAFFGLTKDTSWTYVVDETLRSLQDVVHVGNKFYVVKEMGTLFSFDITSDQSISDKQWVAADTLECFQKSVKTYVVVLDDNELLMVQRVVEFDDGGRWTNEVGIFKLNFDMYEWIETETLGHVALFLDDNFSISVKASNFSGCLPNCIYFNYNFDCVNSYPEHRLNDDYDVYDSGTALKLCFILLYVASNVSFIDKNRGVLSSKNYNFIKHQIIDCRIPTC